MAKFILHPVDSSLGADMANLFATLPNLPKSSFDATHMRYFGADTVKFVFHGTGIKTGAMGSDVFVKAGQIQSAEMLFQGDQIMTITGWHLSAQRLYDVIDSGDTTRLLKFVLQGADTVIGTNLKDILFGFASNDALFGGNGKDQLFGGDDNDRLFGGGGNDAVLGDAGRDSAYGGAGDDNLITGAGNDLLSGGSGADRLDAGSSEDTLYGGAGGDTLFGSFENDQLFGGAGVDTLQGDQGNDRLHGGAASDVLYGGDSADQFVFDTALGPANQDELLDFEVNIDKILLDDDVFSKLGATGPLAGSRFVTGVNAGDANDRIVYDPDTGFLSYDRDGRGGAEAVVFAKLTVGLALDAADFRVIG